MEKISVVLRYHQKGCLTLLKDSLFSLCLQENIVVEPILVLHNCDEAVANEIEEYISLLPAEWARRKDYVLKKLTSDKDIRSKMLNAGLQNASGRYLAFLDYDDIVYDGAYPYLVSRLNISHAALAAGGCRKALLNVLEDGSIYIASKKNFKEQQVSIFDFIDDNQLPIHSYILDRSKIDSVDLHFNEELHALEDYELLLRLLSK